jgi:hypothetical protein
VEYKKGRTLLRKSLVLLVAGTRFNQKGEILDVMVPRTVKF